MSPGARCLKGHKLTLDEKYPGTVPSAQSPVWMMSSLLHWLEKQTLGSPEFTFGCKMAHDMVPEEVKIVFGPSLPLCQDWFPLAGLHVSNFLKECALALKPLLAGIFIQIVLLTKLTFPCNPSNACCRESHCHTRSPLCSVHAQL